MTFLFEAASAALPVSVDRYRLAHHTLLHNGGDRVMRGMRIRFRFEASTTFHRGGALYSQFPSRTSSSPPSSSSGEEKIGTQFWTLPNVITLARIGMSPLIGYAIMKDMKDIALAGCVVGAFSDWLDGYIAKNYNQKVHSLSLSSSSPDALP